MIIQFITTLCKSVSLIVPNMQQQETQTNIHGGVKSASGECIFCMLCAVCQLFHQERVASKTSAQTLGYEQLVE